ncbi:endolytic transglycosylase MltG [Microbacterium sediminis]|uniref:Endolytic murein transglycosylase n=1 Tax=Microbacterium sediminis TaxID=904291 RepID=A0A1B9NGG3_9MICO|nr:endolytic transglycosylase MltG [Microbacterium sediminis]OCG75697.1 hypothetical protein A7J15_01195 [Microbacterium sediminis]QBR74092.1 endolytic transglycosylase MltG [Microbacterium sediminis]
MPETPDPDAAQTPLSRRALRAARARGEAPAPQAPGEEATPVAASEPTAAPEPASEPAPAAPEPAAAESAAPTPAPEPEPEATAPEPATSAEPQATAPIAATPDQAGALSWLRDASADDAERGGDAPEPATRSTLADAAAGDAPGRGEASGSLDDLFGSSATPPKKRRGSGCLIAFVIVLALVGGVVAGGVWAWNTYGERIMEQLGLDGPSDYEPGEATGEALLTIEEGDTGSSISPKLYEAGVTLEPDSFYDYLVENAQAPTFYPGTYRLQQKMTSEAALAALEDPANKLENTAQLREGLTVEQSLPILAEGIGLPLEEFEAAVADPSVYGVQADSLEGWLFPATYTFEPDTSAQDVIRTLVNRTIESLDSAGVPEGDRHRILTIASIIQREGRFEDDFYKVSRVIQNRLDPANPETSGLLQMDSTAQYGVGEMHEGEVWSSEEALTDDNPWNTYVHPGLPIGPIANPGDLAIDAAMHPADGPWLYFTAVNLDPGESKFSETLAEHEQGVAELREWCAANPDYGC